MNTFITRVGRVRAAVVALLLIAFLLPLVVKGAYSLHILIIIAVFAVLAMGQWLILTLGQVSVAQAAFFGLGAYTSAVLQISLGWNSWLSLGAAGVVAAAIAAIIGYPALRLRGIYFIILTLVLGAAVNLVFMYWAGLTGGAKGLAGVPGPDALLGLKLTSKVAFYYLALMIALVAGGAMYRLHRSRIGMTFMAIRQAEHLASSVGVAAARYKVLAFTVACFFAGMVGAFYAQYTHYVGPYDFTFHDSAKIIVYMVLGGTGHILGPLLGTAFVVAIEQATTGFAQYIPLFYGGALILVVLFLPQGLISLPGRVLARYNAGGPERRRHGAVEAGKDN